MKTREANPSKGAVAVESKEEKKARIVRLRMRLGELRLLGFSLAQCTKTLVAEGLLSAPSEAAAYQLVRHHNYQLLKSARGNEIIIEGEREVYVQRLERALRKALVRADGEPDGAGNRALSPMMQYLNLQLSVQIMEKIAAAQGVPTRPKIEADLNIGEKFDPVKEHARAVVEKQQMRAAGKLIDVTPTKKE